MIDRYSKIVLTVIALALAALALIGCEKEDTRPLGERLFERMVARCKLHASKGREASCTNAADFKELHAVMVEQITAILPSNGTCTMHGHQFLICTERLMSGEEQRVMYRLSDANDGSDTQTMSVWSKTW